MKKLSKVLFGSAILAALVFGFAGCTEEDDDDNDMISGSGNNYSISYTNDSSDTSRGYNTTSTKHLGSICQITFNKDSLSNNGAMAYIWDLEADSSRAAKDVRRFCIAGLRIVSTGSEYKAQPYVSIYKNVVDIMANNFGVGTELTATEGKGKGTSYTAKETEKIKLGTETQFSVTPDSTTGAVTVTVKVEPVDESNSYSKSAATKFAVDFYAGAYDESTIKSASTAASTTISASELGYTGDNTYLKQQSAAVYANVYQGKTLNGSWKYVKDYAEAEEVVEE